MTETEQMIEDLQKLEDRIYKQISDFEKKYPVMVKDLQLQTGEYSDRRHFTKGVVLKVQLNRIHQKGL